MSTARQTVSARHRIALNLGRLLALGGTVSVLALTSGATPAQAAFPGENGKIVFTSNRDGNDEIYVMNADGTDQTRLTHDPGPDDSAAFSPDGSRIAFVSVRDGSYDFYVMNADGTDQTRLTNNAHPNSAPAFSPDGSRIAFTSARDGNNEIYVMNADGSGQVNLTNNSVDDMSPAFSPDGSTITFRRTDGNLQDIFAMDADGTHQVNLTSSDDGETPESSFSPDGATIAFGSNRGTAGDLEVFVMDADGSNQTNLTHTTAQEFDPAFSPDGTKITYTKYQSGNRDIYVMNADGTGQTNLTDNAANDVEPDWGPAVTSDDPPETTITGGPSGPIAQATPTFTFTSNEAGSTFECRVDNAAYAACTSAHTTAPLDDGSHTFAVRAVDGSGNVDPSPAARTFTVDTVAPNTFFTGGPFGATNDGTPTFTFTSDEAGVTFECQLDGQSFTPCSSPYTTEELAVDRSYTMQVRATDGAGNVDASPAIRPFSLERRPPDTFMSSGPSALTGDNTPTFGFVASKPGSTFECRVDDAAFAACTSMHTTAPLDDGDHTFEVRATDGLGNVDPSPALRAFTVDTVAPDTALPDGPSGLTNDNTPSFAWASDAARYECRVDDAPFVECESPHTTAALDDVEHTFELRAIDAAGNVDPTPAKLTFTVDTTARVTTITGGPSALTNEARPQFTFETADPDSTFECRVLPQSFDPCTSPYTSPNLADGEHSFEVRSIDPAGNVESPGVARTFTIDTVAPDTTITSGPTGTIRDATPTFGFSSSDPGATLECRVDDAPFGPCASPYTTAPLGNGSHTFQARATDAAGNTDATPASRTFTVNVDNTAPKTKIDSGPADITNQKNATFTFSADEPATFECKLDAGAYASCDSGDTFGPLDAGTHTFAVRATDEAGNVDSVPATRTWIIDTTPPQTTITSGPSSLSLLSSKAMFGFASSEGGSSFQCRLDSGAWQACTSPRTYTHVGLGKHTVSVRATDPAGNTDPTPAKATWLTLALLPL